MKLRPIISLSAAAMVALLLTAAGAFAENATTPTSCPTGQVMVAGKCTIPNAINYNSSKSNTGNIAASPTAPCPTGQVMVDGKCTIPNSINYSASKSNTGNIAASPTAPCPAGQVMVAGKCTAQHN
jgi:hypothetical protein